MRGTRISRKGSKTQRQDRKEEGFAFLRLGGFAAWREVWIWSAGAALLLLATLISSGSCAARQLPPPRSWKPDPSAIPIHPGQPPLIRILLALDFQTALIEGADQAAEIQVKALPNGIELQPLNPPGEAVFATGFRLEPEPSQMLRFNSRPYRGSIEVFINPLGSPLAVNEVSLEDYLKGVVPGEMGPDAFPQLEALKAQAVAARTYTISNLSRQAVLGFDLYGDVRSQVYPGPEAEHRLSNQAVEQTRGRIAAYQKKPILAMYSSTCGGTTAHYGEIFLAAPLPYLEGGVRCRDHSSPFREWEETIRLEEVQQQLDQYAGVGRLRRLLPGRRDATGRLVEMTFEGSSGSATLQGIRLRFALGLRSNWILSLEPHQDNSGWIESLRVRGRGWGHGVGLCQHGALEMAQRGSGYEEILRHYYPGAEILRRY